MVIPGVAFALLQLWVAQPAGDAQQGTAADTFGEVAPSDPLPPPQPAPSTVIVVPGASTVVVPGQASMPAPAGVPGQCVCPPGGTKDGEDDFAVVVAPAVLPRGGSGFNFYVGISELAAAYRFGLGVLEFDTPIRADYRYLTLAAEVLMKVSAYNDKGWQVAPYIGVGFVGNAGGVYWSPANFSYVAVRAAAGLNVHYRAADIVYLIGQLEMTLDISLSPSGAARFTGLVGAGAEVFLAKGLSLSLVGLVGPDIFHPTAAVNTLAFGYGVRLGLGFRLF